MEVSVEGGPYELTVEKCVDSCVSYGFRGAGMELGQQCCTYAIYSLLNLDGLFLSLTKKTTLGLFNQGCGNDTNGVQLIDNSHCMMACSGDSTENCGGPDALIFYLLDG